MVIKLLTQLGETSFNVLCVSLYQILFKPQRAVLGDGGVLSSHFREF